MSFTRLRLQSKFLINVLIYEQKKFLRDIYISPEKSLFFFVVLCTSFLLFSTEMISIIAT